MKFEFLEKIECSEWSRIDNVFISYSSFLHANDKEKWRRRGGGLNPIFLAQIKFCLPGLDPCWPVSQPSIPNPNPFSAANLLVLIHFPIETIPICRVVASHLWNLLWFSRFTNWARGEWYAVYWHIVLTYRGLTSAGINRKVIFTKIAGVHVLSKCPEERHSPPAILNFNMLSGGVTASLKGTC
jgi:hypothetical protein